jgi:hypothetical protein
MAVAPMRDVENSTSPSVRGDEDPSPAPDSSPVTFVLHFLRKQGISNPTPADIHNAVRVLGSHPEFEPGVRIQELDGASEDTPSVGRGGGSSVAGKIEGGGTTTKDGVKQTDGTKQTSASPQSGDARERTSTPIDRAMDKAVAPAGPQNDFLDDYGRPYGMDLTGTGDKTAAALGAVLPSAASAVVLGGRAGTGGPPAPASVATPIPGTPPVGAPGAATPAAASPMGPPNVYGPPTVEQTMLGGVNPIDPGIPGPTGNYRPGPSQPIELPPSAAPMVPFTPRPGGAPRVPPQALTGMDAILEALRQAAKAGRMFK